MEALRLNSLKLTSITLAILAGLTLTACGGGSSSSSAPATSSSTPGSTPGGASGGTGTCTGCVAFATPSSASATAEGGFIDTYGYADTAATKQVITPVAFSSGVVTYSEALSGSPTYAGLALRFSAPGNATTAGTTTYNAGNYANLKIKLTTSNSSDSVIKVMLQPSPVDTNGCAYTGSINVTPGATLQEYTLPLNTASFTFPNTGACANVTPPALSTLKSALFAIDIRNEANSNGTHDIKVEYVKLSN